NELTPSRFPHLHFGIEVCQTNPNVHNRGQGCRHRNPECATPQGVKIDDVPTRISHKLHRRY
ncbi:hypothetical protein NPIL_439761, partial [Nephila pilipes]